MSSPAQHPHRRRHALTGDWMPVSPHRTQRPWQGRQEPEVGEQRLAHDPQRYLCPGNGRANGGRNPAHAGTFVFTNDFAALLPEPADAQLPGGALFQTRRVRGECRAVCFSPRHDLTLARLSAPDIRRGVDTWAELSAKWRWVQVFENKGGVMDRSNPHCRDAACGT